MIIEMKGWRERQKAQAKELPALECPKCETECSALRTDTHGSTIYRCAGNGHRALTWRIDVDGAMLHGEVGRQFYR